jgi:UDP-N-acetyl-D-mannosaminuronic acid dehydrogenase
MVSDLCIIGLGYIGLPTAAVAASNGLSVIGVDINPVIIDTIGRGEIHIVEPGLADLVRKAVRDGKLSVSLTAAPASTFLIAVPTPILPDRKADVRAVMAAADALAPFLAAGNLVILESTSPVGTTEAVAARLATLRPDLRFPQKGGDSADIAIAYCPERVLPGRTLEELVRNDRAIGGVSNACAQRAAAFYRRFVKGQLASADVRSAELCKLAENAFRDVNIAFANELATVSDHLGIDVWEVIRLANRHPRVNILRPGPGVGGHCIAVDPWFIVESAPDATPVIQAARHVNEGRPAQVVGQVLEAASGMATKPVIACLGLAFKANIDDLRESPAIDVVRQLAAADAGTILAVEPHITALPAMLSGAQVQLTSLDDALERADVLVVLVDHQAFLTGADRIAAHRRLVDTRGLHDLARPARILSSAA